MGRFYHRKTRYFLVFCVVEEILLAVVACLYAARQRLSLRQASKKLEISRQKIHEILRKNLLNLKKTYKAKIILKLTEHRRKTCLHCNTSFLEKKNKVKHVWLTEDSYFYSDGKVHLKKGYCSVASKDHYGLLLRNYTQSTQFL